MLKFIHLWGLGGARTSPSVVLYQDLPSVVNSSYYIFLLTRPLLPRPLLPRPCFGSGRGGTIHIQGLLLLTGCSQDSFWMSVSLTDAPPDILAAPKGAFG